ncbi:MAG: DUF397 domain-containing protein [Dactylosporangium sp.]|nr:DUF397 domain-containing protein [Dactylosporangium sp.]NNJ62349.1 DUF397 domain-containing protein [Dactylosporangium sp.]
MTTTPWIKATKSGANGGACVEVRRHAGMIEVRDTKDANTGPTLRFTSLEWDAFLNGTRNGEFVPFLAH